MARTKTYNPFDIGIENLLTGSDEEDFDFDLFMERLWKDFPDPPEGNPDHSIASSSALGQPRVPLEFPFPPQPLRELVNQPQLPLDKQRCTLNDAQLQQFVDDQQNKNTKRKTNSDIKKWYEWCEEHNETRKLEDLPPEELDRLLGHYFVSIRKKDGSIYEPDTLTSFQRSLDRHLTKDLHKPFSIIRDVQFAPSREKLKAARKWLKSNGKGNKPNAAEALEPIEIEKLWSEGGLGSDSPEQLQRTIWWLISTHMGTRGCDEHHKFRLGDFNIKSSSDGTEYVEFCNERGTKTRTGETVKSTNADARVFKPKMWATPEKPERCPVALFKKFVAHRPPEMNTPESPFYLTVNHKRSEFSYWFKKQPLGVNYIDRMMKLVVKSTSITGRKTNHSARKTMVETLCRANIPDSTVMQLSGHKNVQSLNHYKKPSMEQQKSMSHLLSNGCPTLQQPTPSQTTPLASVCEPLRTAHDSAPFSNATFTNCSFVLNFGGPSQQLSNHSSTVSSTLQAPRKRPRVIYDSSDED